jgi:hypothetical protein
MDWLPIVRIVARILSAVGRILTDHDEKETERRGQ